MWGNIFSGLLSVAQGDSPEEILKKQAMATVMGGTAPVGVDSAGSFAPHLAQTGAEQAVASGVGEGLGSELLSQSQELADASVSGINNSVMQNPDFIGTHLTDDFNSQLLQNNYAGTYSDGIADPLQAYPSFDNPVSSTVEEVAKADGGYDPSFFGVFGDTVSKYGEKVNDFTGMENKDWTMLGLNHGANLLQPTPKQPIQHATGGISKPQGNTPSNQASLLSSNPITKEVGGHQLTPEQIMKLKQQGII